MMLLNDYASAFRSVGGPSRYSIWRPSIAAILAVWLFHYLSLTLAGSMVLSNAELVPLRRLIPVGAGIVVSLGVVALVDLAWDRPIWLRGLMVLAVAWLAPIPYALLNLAVFPELSPDQPAFQRLVGMWTGFSHLFFAITIAILTVQYSVKLRERQDRFDRITRLVREAELQALRYQVNPHFLFNALNSVASLLSDRNLDEAERMVENLAEYYQRVLAAGPEHEVPLRDEIEAQESYLAIEKVRFPDRLDVQVKAPPELAYALVPKLILQPLVENVIKHSAGRSTGRVLIEIEARADNGNLLLQVQDTRSEDLSPRTAPSRNGAGLHNIEARLRALHEDAASLSAQALPMGFRVVIRLPLRMAP